MRSGFVPSQREGVKHSGGMFYGPRALSRLSAKRFNILSDLWESYIKIISSEIIDTKKPTIVGFLFDILIRYETYRYILRKRLCPWYTV